MAEFITYTPTAGLLTAERTQAGYYGAWKNWATDNVELNTFFTLTFNDAAFKIIMTPIASNLVNFPMEISIASNAVYFNGTHTRTTSVGNSVSHNYYNYDVTFNILVDGDNIIMRLDSGVSYGGIAVNSILSAKSFDGTKTTQFIAISNPSGTSYICISGSAFCYSVQQLGNFSRYCGGITNTYLVQRFPVPATEYLADKCYYLDGGSVIPNTATASIGGKRYAKILNNIYYLMD